MVLYRNPVLVFLAAWLVGGNFQSCISFAFYIFQYEIAQLVASLQLLQVSPPQLSQEKTRISEHLNISYKVTSLSFAAETPTSTNQSHSSPTLKTTELINYLMNFVLSCHTAASLSLFSKYQLFFIAILLPSFVHRGFLGARTRRKRRDHKMICLVNLWLLLLVQLLGGEQTYVWHTQESIFLSYYKSDQMTTCTAFNSCY